MLDLIGYDAWALHAIIWLPLAGMVHVLWAPEERAKHLALRWSALTFLLSLGLWWAYDPGLGGGYQLLSSTPWIGQWGASYAVGLDGISLFMVLLTTLTTPLAILGSFNYITKRERAFYALMLLLEVGVVGVFAAADLFLFYVFFELTLVPMYFIVGIWGGERRIYAAVKFFLYTAFGSLLMLVGVLYLYFRARTLTGAPSFAFLDLMQVSLSPVEQLWLLRGVRPRLCDQGPTLPVPHLAARRARRGADSRVGRAGRGASEDGDLRVRAVPSALLPPGLPTPRRGHDHAGAGRGGDHLCGLGGCGAAGRQEARRLHLGGPHGLCGDRNLRPERPRAAGRHDRDDLPWDLDRHPLLAARDALRAPADARDRGLWRTGTCRPVVRYRIRDHRLWPPSVFPGTSGFIGEFLALLGTFERHPVIGTLAATGVIFAAYYMLPMVQRVFFNALEREENRTIEDLSRREITILAPMIALLFWIGVYPTPLLRRMEPSVEAVIERVEAAATPAVGAGVLPGGEAADPAASDAHGDPDEVD